MRIISITYEKTGQDSQRHEVGTVEARLSNAEVVTFEDVDRNDFDHSEAARYDPKQVPYDMAFAVGILYRRILRQEAAKRGEILAETDDVDDEPEIRADDFLGMETGIPSPGFETP